MQNHTLGTHLWVCVMALFAWAGIKMTDRIGHMPQNTTTDKAT